MSSSLQLNRDLKLDGSKWFIQRQHWLRSVQSVHDFCLGFGDQVQGLSAAARVVSGAKPLHLHHMHYRGGQIVRRARAMPFCHWSRRFLLVLPRVVVFCFFLAVGTAGAGRCLVVYPFGLGLLLGRCFCCWGVEGRG